MNEKDTLLNTASTCEDAQYGDLREIIFASIDAKITAIISEMRDKCGADSVLDLTATEGKLERLDSISPNAREIALRMPELHEFLFQKIEKTDLEDEKSRLRDRDHQAAMKHAKMFLDLLNQSQKYHNKPHGLDVADTSYVFALIINDQDGKDNKSIIKESEIQSMQLAGLFHDIAHSGTIGGDDFEKNVRRAMRFAFAFMKLYGYTKRQIIDTLCMIYATTSFSDIDPHTLQEAIMVFADLTGGIRSGWDGFLEECSRVYAESVSRPKNFEEWYTRTRGFLDTYLPQKLAVCKLRGIPADVLQEAENGRKYCLEQLDLMKTTKSEEEKETFFRTKIQKQ